MTIESYAKNARTPHSATLSAATESRDVLLGDDKRDPVRFRLVLTREMGAGRKSTRKPGFIDSILDLIETFYGTVVQNISQWTPKAPKISAPATQAASVNDDPQQDDQVPLQNEPPAPSAPPQAPSPVPFVAPPWTTAPPG